MQPLAQPPRKDDRSFDDWMYRLWKRIASTAGLAWDLIDKTGSNLTDLTTRNHADLQNINTASYTHLTATNATDLTDGGATTLHKHDHNAQDNLQGGTTSEYYHNTLHEDGLIDIIDTQWSTGIIGTANLVTDSGSGEIDIASCDVLLRATDSDTADISKYTVPALTNQTLTDQVNNMVYAEYNAGTPRFIITTVERTDTNTNILIANVYRNGTSLHINNYVAVRANDNMRRVALRFVETLPLGYVSGAIISETGTRNLAVTAGSFWICTNPFTTNAFDSSAAGTFSYEYQDGAGGWTEQSGQTQINNTQYDDGSGTLQTLTANRYAVAWVYQEVDSDIVVLYGRGDYTLSQANAESAPNSVPPRISAQGYLLGKIILQKSAAAFTSVESAFSSVLSTSQVTDHEQLAGLLGGAANDHSHLTSAQNTDLTDGGDSTLHYHASDRDLANATGTLANAKGGTGQDSSAWSGIPKVASGTWSVATSGTDYSAGTSALATGILKSTTTTGALSIAAAATDYVAPSSYASSNGLTMATARLLGRSTAGTGAAEEITVGSGLSLSGGSLTATGGSSTADMFSLTCTQASGALTFAGVSHTQTFRSTTLTDGAVSTITADPADLVLPSGGTLGFTTTVQGRITVAEMNNAGVAEYAICKSEGGLQLDEENLISTTAIGTGSDSANVWYSTTARTNLPYRIVGYVDAVNTAGAWGNPVAVSPTAAADKLSGQCVITNVQDTGTNLNVAGYYISARVDSNQGGNVYMTPSASFGNAAASHNVILRQATSCTVDLYYNNTTALMQTTLTFPSRGDYVVEVDVWASTYTTQYRNGLTAIARRIA